MRGMSGDWDKVLRLLWGTTLGGKGRGGKFGDARKTMSCTSLYTLDVHAHWCVAQMAKRQGDEKICPSAFSLVTPLVPDSRAGILRIDSDYYEGENWNYSFRFLHDMVGRIKAQVAKILGTFGPRFWVSRARIGTGGSPL